MKSYAATSAPATAEGAAAFSEKRGASRVWYNRNMKITNIALAFEDGQLAQAILPLLQELPNVRIKKWDVAQSASTMLDIVFVDDTTDPKAVLSRLKDLNDKYPQTSFFVVSKSADPEHIVQVMKAGGGEYIIVPTTKEKLETAINEIIATKRTKASDEDALVYTFINSKGGLGTTTLAVNTAVALAKDDVGASTAIWDMSFQSGDASVLLDIVPETTIRDMCKNIHRLDFSLLQSSLIRHEDTGIDLLAAPILPEESDEILPSHLSTIFDIMTDAYDYIIVDSATIPVNKNSVEAFKVSTKIFIVIDLSVPAVRNAARIYQFIQSMGISPNTIEFVVNRFTKGGTLPIADAEENLGKKIFWFFPNDFKVVISSINDGEPLVNSSPSSMITKVFWNSLSRLKILNLKISIPRRIKAFGGFKYRVNCGIQKFIENK